MRVATDLPGAAPTSEVSLPAPARIVGVGTATPDESYTQQELLEIFGITDPRVRSVFLNGGIDRRHLILPPNGPDGRPVVETQGELLAKHSSNGAGLAAAAVEAALLETGASKEDVAHLCCISSTGFITPGFSALLIRDLGLPRHCSRLDVVGMGCNAGLNGLSAVTAWAETHPGQLAVMVCIEACSAAYVFDGSMRTAVVNSLFGDGAAAIGVRTGPSKPDASAPAILRFSSWLIPEASDAMRYDWDEEQNRFSFYLDPQVPYTVGSQAPVAVDRLLAGAGLRRGDIQHWVVHSGGKRVIDSIRVNLGLTRYDLRWTTTVLREVGNVSSGAFLFSLERLQTEGVAVPGDHGVLMTMGPGSTIELALVKW